MSELRVLGRALRKLFYDCGFSMAGAVAFSFVLSLFPFFIFLGALASTFGGRGFADEAVRLLFEVLPAPVAETLAPQVTAVMGQSQYGLLTIGAAVALFFATSAIESLRAALNTAYHVQETRSYFRCLLQSCLIVFASAIGVLALAAGVVVGPVIVWTWRSPTLNWIIEQGYFNVGFRYTVVTLILMGQLFVYHLWLAAGRRTVREVWPGVVLSILLWLVAAAFYSRYLILSDYSRFYAGLTQLMSAFIFFQFTSMIVILGAEFNRCLAEASEELPTSPG